MIEQSERAGRFSAKGTNMESYVEELFAMLIMPDAYECYWHDGEIYLSRVIERPEAGLR